ncbi:dGTPase [Pseudomonas oryzihabitans]
MSDTINQKCIWSTIRQPRARQSAEEPVEAEPHRSVFQQDYDRLLFSTPVRRLADKTQVWPMEENDGVRTRLTHSHEVANLARSIGTKAYRAKAELFKDCQGLEISLSDTIHPLLLSIGLGHDLGNPPFGHQGEAAIGNWFKKREGWIFNKPSHDSTNYLPLQIPIEYQLEFTQFDGNPQSLRLLTKLQTHIEGLGLDLSATTLAAGLKYPVSYQNIDKKIASSKKGGYFTSEKSVVNWIREKTGLEEGQRHPLTWIMEACDDIAYSVLDVDDVLKKGMVSPDDVLAILRHKRCDCEIIKNISSRFENVEQKGFVSEIQRDIKTQYLRALLIDNLISHASASFTTNGTAIFSYLQTSALMDDSELCENLKEIAKTYAFGHPTVLKAEALGAAAIDGLMSAFWEAITDRKDPNDLDSKRLSARSKYIYSKISPNYINNAKIDSGEKNLESSLRYRELRLLTDMVSGMTDSYAMRLWGELQAVPYVNRA